MQKITIITINLNKVGGLKKTIESVVNQTFTDFEYIIIDGGSTDGSEAVIKDSAGKITYWISEPDKGIYNAMNKGILKATAKYCLFLNSGDCLADDKVLEDYFRENYIEDIISGNFIINNDKSEIRKSPQKNELDFSFFVEGTLPHPATFIKRELFLKYGLYNENNIIVSDWEFFLKCILLNNCSYNQFERTISIFDSNGISSQSELKALIDKEKEFVFQSYLPLFYKTYLRLMNKIDYLNSHEDDYNIYMNLKNGKFSFIIELILQIKKWINKL
ncbi:MAG TPA: glycosyltransferase family 2 protein [Bacteroidales bacterium]|nr:glycosyltransferase family 2 protein [Bacteroidales bacterium]